jgi:GDP-mannose 4,6-dehydratase
MKMSKILITGITGMVGSHLADYLLSLDEAHIIYGVCRWRSDKDNIAHLLEVGKKKIIPVDADLCDLSSLISRVNSIKPDIVFHLAAQSFVLTSFTSPAQTLMTNCIGTSNLLEAIRLVCDKSPIVHICSSSEVYGQVKEEELPITENNQFRPASPYAVSKVCEDMLGLQYFLSYGMKTIRTRTFSHTGPRRGEKFAMSAFAKQIAEAETGKCEPIIKVGNLDSVRTFLDVRDVVKAYWLLVNKCDYGDVYNIAGNRTMTVGEALNMLLSLSDIKFTIQVDPKLYRPSDVTLQVPSMKKFQDKTGWEPTIPIEKTFQDLLLFWRKKIK